MGEVYEAQDTRKNNRTVALKLISQQYSDNPAFRARMQREADIAGRLTEPHIVPIHDYGDIDGQFYVEMRLIEGTSLRQILTQYGPLTPARTVAVVRQVASALDAAHAGGITHRDVKPENILIAANDFAYLVDFGIARGAADPSLTQSGMAVGTYNYMAPERFTGDEVTYRADIYALACVLGECLTGAPPYRADSVERLIASHLMEPAPRPSQIRPGRIPEALDRVVAKGMAKNPNERYVSAGDLAQAAHDALTAPEQRQEANILQHQGDNNATVMSPVVNPANFGGGFANYHNSGAYQQNSGAYQQNSGAYEQASATQRSPQIPTPPPVPQYQSSDETMVRPVPSNTGGWGTQPPTNRVDTGDPYTQAAPVAPNYNPSQPHALNYNQSQPHALNYNQSQPHALNYNQSQPHALSTPPQKKSRKPLLIGAIIAVLLIVAGVTAFVLTRPGEGSKEPTGQVALPFNGLNFRLSPGGVAVDDAGTVYITNQTMYGRVVTLSPGSTTPVLKPFTGLYEPQGIAVDNSGKIYVSDFNNRVVALPAGSNNQIVLPFDGLNYPEGVAVDAQGNVYVADRGNNRVLKLEAGQTTQTVLPFNGLKNPDGVAVDKDGNVYVTDTDNNRVLRLDDGTNNQTVLPFTGLSAPWGITVDNKGAVYVTEHDNNRVVKLTPGATAPEELPFKGLNTPLSVAVDKKFTVYVADRGNVRVLKLAQND